MLKRWQFIGILSLLLLGTGGATFYYFWREATRLPEWYVNQPPTHLNELNNKVIVEKIKQKVKAQVKRSQERDDGAPTEVNLTGEELNQLVAAKLTEKANPQLAMAIKGLDTEITADRLKTGAVVNLSDIEPKEISDRSKTWLNDLTQKFPALANREVYIGIEGKPQINNGRLMFDANTRVQVGQLSFTVIELAARLGISEATLLEKMNLNLNLNDLKVEAIDLKADSAVLRGVAR